MSLYHPLGRSAYITSHFGKRGQVSGVKVSTTDHLGTDLRASVGTPVFAAEAGVVYAYRRNGVYSGPRIFTSPVAGNWILVWHPSRNLYVTYAHLNTVDVGLNQKVSRGQRVATSGATGGVAAHLHVGVWTRIGTVWTAHNPVNYFNFVSDPNKASTTVEPTKASTTVEPTKVTVPVPAPVVVEEEDDMKPFLILANDGLNRWGGGAHYALVGPGMFVKISSVKIANEFAERFGDAINVSYAEWDAFAAHGRIK